MEQVQQARHVARVGPDGRRQLADAERRPRPRRPAPARSGRPWARAATATTAATAQGLRSSPRDEMKTVGRSSTRRMLPDQVDVADPLLGQPLARARAQERRDDDVGVRRHAVRSAPATSPTSRGSSCRRAPMASAALAPAGVLMVSRASATSLVFSATFVDQCPGRTALNLLDGVAQNHVVTGRVVAHAGQQRHSGQRRIVKKTVTPRSKRAFDTRRRPGSVGHKEW